MTFRLLAAITLAALAVPLAAQPADPVAARQAIMKQNGRDTGAGAKMLKGEVPYRCRLRHGHLQEHERQRRKSSARCSPRAARPAVIPKPPPPSGPSPPNSRRR